MQRLIDADATIEAFLRAATGLAYQGRVNESMEYVTAARVFRESAIVKTIEAEPVRHVRWVEHPDNKCSLFNGWECSECKQIVSGGKGNYCPNCRAKMDAKEEQ